MKKDLKRELEITQIVDESHSKYNQKKEETETIETRKVIFKGENFSLIISGPADDHPLDDLSKSRHIGLKAQMILRIGENPQKTLKEVI